MEQSGHSHGISMIEHIHTTNELEIVDECPLHRIFILLVLVLRVSSIRAFCTSASSGEEDDEAVYSAAGVNERDHGTSNIPPMMRRT